MKHHCTAQCKLTETCMIAYRVQMLTSVRIRPESMGTHVLSPTLTAHIQREIFLHNVLSTDIPKTIPSLCKHICIGH